MRQRGRVLAIDTIQEAVCDGFGVTVLELISPRREARLVNARHAAVWLARESGYTLAAIGLVFGDRDHTTILNSVARAGRLMAEDPCFAARLAAIRAVLTPNRVA